MVETILFLIKLTSGSNVSGIDQDVQAFCLRESKTRSQNAGLGSGSGSGSFTCRKGHKLFLIFLPSGYIKQNKNLNTCKEWRSTESL